MANTTAYVNSCTKSGSTITLVLGDALSSPTNTFTATFSISDENGATTGTAMTTLIKGLFA